VANIETSLKEAMTIDGAIGVALVDYTSGLTLGVMGGAPVMDMNIAAAGNTDVVRAKVRTLEMLGLSDSIEDILITLDSQYHLIRLLQDKSSGEALFLYLSLNKSRANLGLARHQLRKIESELEI
jgi:UDP-2,3-diacylglucosamine pyrophosphatase LpxH